MRELRELHKSDPTMRWFCLVCWQIVKNPIELQGQLCLEQYKQSIQEQVPPTMDEQKTCKQFFFMLSNHSFRNSGTHTSPELNRYLQRKPSRNQGPTYSNASNKSSSSHYKSDKSLTFQSREESAKRSKDCMKKLIFENQDVNRKAKQLQLRCDYLEIENRQLQQKYQELKENYLKVREWYETFEGPKEKQLPQKINNKNKKQTSDTNVFGFLLKMRNENEPPAKKQPSILDLSKRKPDSHHPTRAKQNMNQQSLQKISEQSAKKIDSVSIMVDCADVQTQTDLKWAYDSIMLSPSSKESELVKEISRYKNVVQDMQKKYNDIATKYERIRAILGGGEGKSH